NPYDIDPAEIIFIAILSGGIPFAFLILGYVIQTILGLALLFQFVPGIGTIGKIILSSLMYIVSEYSEELIVSMVFSTIGDLLFQILLKTNPTWQKEISIGISILTFATSLIDILYAYIKYKTDPTMKFHKIANYIKSDATGLMFSFMALFIITFISWFNPNEAIVSIIAAILAIIGSVVTISIEDYFDKIPGSKPLSLTEEIISSIDFGFTIGEAIALNQG
ncbi:MAG: hypothetical protein QXH42_10015, partial [Thermoplasmata archaeon]